MYLKYLNLNIQLNYTKIQKMNFLSEIEKLKKNIEIELLENYGNKVKKKY